MRTNGTLDVISDVGLRQLLSMASPRLVVAASLLSGPQLALSVRLAQALYVETFTDLLLRFFFVLFTIAPSDVSVSSPRPKRSIVFMRFVLCFGLSLAS